MGKASKWIINFLLGRKEDKGKKKDITFYEENKNVITPSSSVPSTPTYKRRWSFGKSSSKETNVRAHKSSKSLDLITVNPLITRAELESHHRRTNAMALVFPPSSQYISKVGRPINSSDLIRKTVEDAAATRIQAAFRSYLARKALHALKGLVKLQALVRGHLVRKQTTDTIRRMHAVMAIQVRARLQRIQLAEDSRRVVRSQSSRHRLSSRVNGLGLNKTDGIDVNLYSKRRAHDKNNSHLSQLQVARVDHGASRKYNSDDLLSMLKHEDSPREIHLSSMHNSPVSPLTHASPNIFPGRASFTCKQPDYMPPVAPSSPSQPSYMANTESSKAKARSTSEPKQRPQCNVKQTGNSTISKDEMDIPHEAHMQHPSSRPMVDQGPWFTKIYRSTRASNSTHSNYLVTYEPHLNLY